MDSRRRTQYWKVLSVRVKSVRVKSVREGHDLIDEIKDAFEHGDKISNLLCTSHITSYINIK